jgi:hypothetical protein
VGKEEGIQYRVASTSPNKEIFDVSQTAYVYTIIIPTKCTRFLLLKSQDITICNFVLYFCSYVFQPAWVIFRGLNASAWLKLLLITTFVKHTILQPHLTLKIETQLCILLFFLIPPFRIVILNYLTNQLTY